MTTTMVMCNNTSEYVDNPERLFKEHHKSLSNKIYMLTGLISDEERFDGFLKEKVGRSKKSFEDEYSDNLECGRDIELIFVNNSKLGLRRNISFILSKKALIKKGINLTGFYEVDRSKNAANLIK